MRCCCSIFLDTFAKIFKGSVYLYGKLFRMSFETFSTKYFEKYKGELAAKIDTILGYNEADAHLDPADQWEYALPGCKKYIDSGYYRYMLARYLYSVRFIRNKRVLEAGSGLGWGAYLISGYPDGIMAIDINEQALCFAREKWKDPRLVFKEHSVLDLASLNKRFDVVIGFELIEHLTFGDGKQFLGQAFSVLDRKGIMILSSSFADSSEQAKDQERQNIYHLKIYTKDEMEALAREAGFRETKFIGNFIAVIKK